jgi:excisionase family DNA binding protein
MSDRDVIGTKVIAYKLGVSRSTALRLIKKGELKVYKYGQNSSQNRCRESDLEAFQRRKRGE